MHNYRLYIAGFAAITVLSAAVVHARDNADTRTPQQKCDDTRKSCLLGCNQLAGADNRAKCLADCDYKYLQCANVAARPRRPITLPTAPIKDVGVTTEKSRPTPTATPTPQSSATEAPKKQKRSGAENQ